MTGNGFFLLISGTAGCQCSEWLVLVSLRTQVGLVGPCRQVVERWVWWVVPGRQVVTRCFWSDWMGGGSLLCFFAVEAGVLCVCERVCSRPEGFLRSTGKGLARQDPDREGRHGWVRVTPHLSGEGPCTGQDPDPTCPGVCLDWLGSIVSQILQV